MAQMIEKNQCMPGKPARETACEFKWDKIPENLASSAFLLNYKFPKNLMVKMRMREHAVMSLIAFVSTAITTGAIEKYNLANNPILPAIPYNNDITILVHETAVGLVAVGAYMLLAGLYEMKRRSE